MEPNRGEKGSSMDEICGDAILIIDMNGSIVKTNQDVCRVLGLSEPEIIRIGLPGILAYIHDLPGKNHEAIEWEIISKKTVDQDGIVLITMTLRDARSGLMEGAALEEKFYRLHETMLQGVVYQDKAGKIISFNPAAARILGWDNGFLSSTKTSVSQELLCIHEDGTPFPGQEHPAMIALETGKAVLGVVMGIYNPIMGMYRWIVIDAVPLFKRGIDRPYQVYTIFYDVTEKKGMEEALLKSQRRKSLLADVSNQLLRYEDPLKIIDDIGHKMMDFLKCDVFFNYMVDAEQGRLELNAYGGIPTSDAVKIRWLEFDDTVCGRVAVGGKRIVAEDIDVKRPPGTDLVRSYGVQVYACNPIIAQGKTIGTLSFGAKARRHFSDLVRRECS